jgi:hypothetical protein
MFVIVHTCLKQIEEHTNKYLDSNIESLSIALASLQEEKHLFERIFNQIETINSSHILKYQIPKSEYFQLTKQYTLITYQSPSPNDDQLAIAYYLLTNEQQANVDIELLLVISLLETIQEILGFSLPIDLLNQLENEVSSKG